jgi:hypothetical protein
MSFLIIIIILLPQSLLQAAMDTPTISCRVVNDLANFVKKRKSSRAEGSSVGTALALDIISNMEMLAVASKDRYA